MEARKRIKVERDKRKLSQEDLARIVGISQVAIKKIESGQTVKSKYLPNIAQALGIPLGELDPSIGSDMTDTPQNLDVVPIHNSVVRHDSATTMTNGEQKVSEIIPGTALVGEVRDFPLFGSTHSGRGAMVLSSEPVDWTVRPSTLVKVRDGYGLIYINDDMSPKYESGYTLMVNPHVPPRLRDGCIFRRPPASDGSISFCVKEFVRETHDLWYVKQYSPNKSFALKKSEWPICHVIVGGVFR
jgi:transcriptional regulator with XRE-family HTH domain